MLHVRNLTILGVRTDINIILCAKQNFMQENYVVSLNKKYNAVFHILKLEVML